MDEKESIPSEYRPLGAWGYVGYQIIFSIPMLGFVFLIIFALDNTYIARRNFARSYFCILLLTLIILIPLILISGFAFIEYFQNIPTTGF